MYAECDVLWDEMERDSSLGESDALGNEKSFVKGVTDITHILDNLMDEEKEVNGYTKFHRLCALP